MMLARGFMLATLLFLVESSKVSAQGSPEETYQQLVVAAKKKNWKLLFSKMTDSAIDQLCVESYRLGKEFTTIDEQLEPNLPEEIIDARPAFLKLYKKYKIDSLQEPKLKLDRNGQPSKEQVDEFDKQQRAFEKTVVKKIRESGTKEFVVEINTLFIKSPFDSVPRSIFIGKLTDLKIDKGSATAAVKVDLSALENSPDLYGALAMEYHYPKLLIKLAKIDGQWKFDGIDYEAMLKQFRSGFKAEK